MKILLFGKNGQVGSELQRSLAPLGELTALERKNQEICGDLTDLNGIAQTISTVSPQIIVNAAAYTAVDKAEADQATAQLINAYAPALLAQEAKKCGAWLIHYSTDYVFNGSGDQPWMERDTPQPLNIYGKTKYEGEQAIQKSGCLHLIFRTSWVYGVQGNNFAKTIMKLAKDRENLSVVKDQIGTPTGADLIADVTAEVVGQAIKNPEVSDLYHLTASGETSWFEYAKFVVHLLNQAGLETKLKPDNVIPILSQDFLATAKRPLNSRLDTSKLRQTFNLELPHWQIGVETMISKFLK